MKAFKSILSGFVLSLSMVPTAHAAGGKVLNVERVSEMAIEVAIETPYHCNAPVVMLNYLYTGNQPAGPSYYEVSVTPITRQACFGRKVIRSTIEIPKLPGFGRHILVITGDDGSSASVEIY